MFLKTDVLLPCRTIATNFRQLDLSRLISGGMESSLPTKSRQFKIIALISGGKDSFFSLLHCLANNHRVIALANLYPPAAASASDDENDLNSYMYQTAGHGLIPLYADALRIPLYRREIFGGPRNSSKDYHSIADERVTPSLEGKPAHELDETESLLPLLGAVLEVHPTANALCSGAILSTYQRTRIESIARRLNLVPLSYLWQYPLLPPPSPGGLLDDMAAAGFDVRIVKVASGGLDEDLLWCNLMDSSVRRKVEKSVTRFGGSVLGEGGEYETLIVDGPTEVFKGRIKLQNHKKWIGRGGGGEAWLGFKGGAGKVSMKDQDQSLDINSLSRKLRTPRLWDAEFEALLGRMSGVLPNFRFNMLDGKQLVTERSWRAKEVVCKNERTLTLSNITAVDSGTAASDQMMGIESKLFNILRENDHPDTNDIVFTTIVLRSMSDFAEVNDVYGQLFTLPNPPARVTVACGDTLPAEVKLMVSFVIDLGNSATRGGLHVQSRSYWAPSNIGPYSQAISVPVGREKETSLVYVAGQIPLVPASMELLQGSEHDKSKWKLFQQQTCLALQHLWRIGKAMSLSQWTGAVAFIAGEDDTWTKARMAWETWRNVHSRDLWEETEQEVDVDGLDVWYQRYGGMGSLMKQQAENMHLPDFGALSNPATSDVPGFFAVQVDALPRDCTIEWQSLGMTRPIVEIVSYMEVPLQELDNGLGTKLVQILEREENANDVHMTVYTPRPALISRLNVQIVPCRAVWGRDGVELIAGVVLQQVVKS